MVKNIYSCWKQGKSVSLISNIRKIVLVNIYLLVFNQCAYAQTEFSKPFQEATVASTFIYNLITYVAWPQKKKSFTICVLEDKNVSAILKKIQEDPRYKTPISVDDTPQSYNQCHILYIGANEKKRIPDILLETKDKPILTVSSVRGFATKGGGVEFSFDVDSTSMKANLETIENSNIKIDADLLEIVEPIE